ncbi:hypothetical protein BCR42DRAFT_496635 [Absidia repens]|uniref:Uncharacterized protein n=1 Tax=Absidia repens TaxID=90262 RepID=A0A1X2HYW4_9FUNG|nr:hypothetical protein BCR42DRAFT_496635 [Absidia repens]
MAHLKKRARADSLQADDTTWQKPLTMIENLQGSTAKLTSTLNNLSLSVDLLDNVTPSLRRFSAMAQMERKYEMVTSQDIEQAQAAVTKETMPEIELLLNEAQNLIDQLGVLTLETERKVHQQDKSLASIHPSPSPSLQKDEDKQQKLVHVENRMQWCQSRQQALAKESNDLNMTLSALDQELEQLDKDLASSQQQLQQKAAHDAAVADQRQQQQVFDDDDDDETHLAEEEARLINELEMIRTQHQEQLQRQRLKQQQQQQEQQRAEDMKRREMEQQDASTTMTQDTCEEQLAIMQEIMDYLRTETDVPPMDLDELQTYLAKLEKEKTRIPSPADLESKVANNRALLKIYCKNVLPNKNMGFVAQRLIDLLFTNQGYKAYTQQALLEVFDSPRQKELVKQFVERYDITSEV